jgi:hypothetical protein
MNEVVVTDHALLRYAERFLGLDIEQWRREILAAVKEGAAVKAREIRVNGVSFVLRHNPIPVVVTIKTLDMILPKPLGGPMGHASNNLKNGGFWADEKSHRAMKRRLNQQGGRRR